MPLATINLLRGCRQCRQGDPIAAYLFILKVEILLRRLNTSKAISAWRSKKGLEHLQEQYADDLMLFLRFLEFEKDKAQFNEILNVLAHFEKISSLAVNLKKTSLVPFGQT